MMKRFFQIVATHGYFSMTDFRFYINHSELPEKEKNEAIFQMVNTINRLEDEGFISLEDLDYIEVQDYEIFQRA